MALIFIDGFDHYEEIQLSDKGWTYSGTYTNLSNSLSRFGIGNGVSQAYSSQRMRKNLEVTKSTIYMGIACKKVSPTTPQYLSGEPLIRFEDEAGISQVKFHVSPTYEFLVYNGADVLLGSSGINAITSYKWYYLELKVVISDTVGVVEVRLNETEIINETGLDTKYGSDYIQYITLAGYANDMLGYYDDFYVDDAQFHGDCRIRAFVPDLDGNSADFTRSAGANDYECVDDNPSNEDTDYISSDTLNHKSIFGITTGALGTVKGIQVNNHCRIDEAGTRKITPIIRSNVTDYQGTETDIITAAYLFEHEIWELDPDDSGAWTQTKLEAAEFGLEITT